MEMRNHDADPTAEPVGDHRPDPSGAEGESASDFYDAEAPPFPELPEKPPKAPSMPTGGAAGTVPADAGSAVSRQVQIGAGAAAAVALLALVLHRRRRNASRDRVGRRARRS